jgi:hypothetical protein
MLNNFATRATVPVTITITGFVIVCCLVLYSYIKGDLLRDTVQHEVSLADTIVKSTRHTMLKSDRETLMNMIDSIGDQESVEHVLTVYRCLLSRSIQEKPAQQQHDKYQSLHH